MYADMWAMVEPHKASFFPAYPYVYADRDFLDLQYTIRKMYYYVCCPLIGIQKGMEPVSCNCVGNLLLILIQIEYLSELYQSSYKLECIPICACVY